MIDSFRIALAIALALASISIGSQTPEPHVLREDFGSAKAIRDVIARSTLLPPRKRYQDMTEAEKDVVRGFYADMGPNDEPPYPSGGLAQVLSAMHRGHSKLRVTGDLYIVVEISATGEALTATAYGSPSPELVNMAASVLLRQSYKPALCKGQPCAQKFPFYVSFVLE